MTVKMTLKTISEPDNDLLHFVDDFTSIAQDIGQETFRDIENNLLDELKFYPPPPPNNRYVRTYRLRAGWKAGITRISNDRFALVVSNDTEYTAFVVGSLAQALSVAARFQADVHKNRWRLASETVAFWFDAYLEKVDAGFKTELSKFGRIRNTRRAFTGRTR